MCTWIRDKDKSKIWKISLRYTCEIEIRNLIFILTSLWDTKHNSPYKPRRGWGPKSDLEVSDGHHTKILWQQKKIEAKDLDRLAIKCCHVILQNILCQSWNLIHKQTRTQRLPKINHTPLKTRCWKIWFSFEYCCLQQDPIVIKMVKPSS